MIHLLRDGPDDLNDSRLATYSDWKRPNEEGVVYYLKNGRVRGVLLWNVWEQVPAARGPFTPANLKGRLPAKSGSCRGLHDHENH